MTDAYGNESIFDYNPKTGVHRAKVSLNGPEEESALETILSTALSGISTLKETRTADSTQRKIEYFPHQLEFNFQQIIPYLDSIVNPKKYQKPICTIIEISGRVWDTSSMEINLNLPVNGRDAKRNKEIIQNLNYEIRTLNAKLETTYRT